MAPNNLPLVIAMADAQTENGDCRQAKDLIEKQLELHPHSAELYTQLAYAHACLEDYRKALSAAEKAVAPEPSDRTHALLAAFQNWDGRIDEALDSYGRAAAVAAHPAVYIESAGQMLFDADRAEDAETELAVASSLMSNDPEALYEVCRVRVFQEKYQSAAGACSQAHNLDMQNASVGRIYGLALLGSNQPAKAVQMLELALHDEPDSGLGHYWLALALMKTRKYKEAQAELEAYVKLDDTDLRAAQLLALVEQGWPLKDSAGVAQLTELGQPLLKGKLKAQVTGKTAADRTLALQINAAAGETNQQLFLDTFVVTGAGALFGARLNPPISRAVIRSYDGKGKPFLTVTGDIAALEDIALGIASDKSLLGRLRIEPAPGGKQGVTAADVEQTGKDIVELRGLKERVPITVTMAGQAEFVKGYQATMTEEMLGQQAQSAALYRLLGVLGPKDDLQSLTSDMVNEEILGYYDPETDVLQVLKDKTPDAIQQLTVAHEYVHTLQDQNFTVLLNATKDSDADLAVRALVEGDASLASEQYAEKGLAPEDMVQFLGSAQAESRPGGTGQRAQVPWRAAGVPIRRGPGVRLHGVRSRRLESRQRSVHDAPAVDGAGASPGAVSPGRGACEGDAAQNDACLGT